ncbi:MAG: RsmD family RNA methyltransferase, partial [Solirubrobacterales bacterium]
VRHLDLVDRCEIVRADVKEWLRSRADGERFDLVFLDPPYGIWPDLGPEIGPPLAGVIAPRGRVVIESGSGSPPRLPGFETVRERRYGRTVVTFHALPEDASGATDR